MNASQDNAVAFQRTLWSTTIDTGDEANDAVIWSGAAADVVKFKLEVLITRVHDQFKVTPGAIVSNDGEAWSAVAWIGTPPSTIVGEGLYVVGPFEIDPSHGKASLRIVLRVEATGGTSLVFGQVHGRLTLFDAEKAEVDVTGSYAAGDGLGLTGTTFSVDGTIARTSALTGSLLCGTKQTSGTAIGSAFAPVTWDTQGGDTTDATWSSPSEITITRTGKYELDVMLAAAIANTNTIYAQWESNPGGGWASLGPTGMASHESGRNVQVVCPLPYVALNAGTKLRVTAKGDNATNTWNASAVSVRRLPG